MYSLIEHSCGALDFGLWTLEYFITVLGVLEKREVLQWMNNMVVWSHGSSFRVNTCVQVLEAMEKVDPQSFLLEAGNGIQFAISRDMVP